MDAIRKKNIDLDVSLRIVEVVLWCMGFFFVFSLMFAFVMMGKAV